MVETGSRIIDPGSRMSKIRRLELSANRVRYTCVELYGDYEDTRPLFIPDYITPRLQLPL